MHLYRIENEAKAGPFTGFSNKICVTLTRVYDDAQAWYESHSADDMPTPMGLMERGSALYELAIKWDIGSHKFAFENLTQLESAFPCPVGRRAMQEHGARLSVYFVAPQHVVRGHCQCVYKEKAAKLVQILDLTSFEEIT